MEIFGQKNYRKFFLFEIKPEKLIFFYNKKVDEYETKRVYNNREVKAEVKRDDINSKRSFYSSRKHDDPTNPPNVTSNNANRTHDDASPLFGYNNSDYIAKLKQKQAEKQQIIVGSILDMPLPSDNDAISEYSTFVNNIFSK